MVGVDKSAVLLRLLTNETSYNSAEADAKALEELAFPHERRPSIEMTSPPPTSSTEGARRTFKGWLTGKTPPLN